MFNELINEELVNALEQQNIKVPTEVQKRAIPSILNGVDLIVESNTGTGKTLAYLLPAFQKIDMDIKKPQIIIIAPTHELASQVYSVAQLIGSHIKPEIPVALIIGGANIKRQIEKLKEKPRIIIGSTGRILELIRLKKITSHYVKTIVLDEADRMIDLLNIEDISSLIKTTLKDRQLLFFSATIDSINEKTAKDLCKENVEVIKIDSEFLLPENIEHIYFECERRDKIEIIKKVIHAKKIDKALIFLNKQEDATTLVSGLNYHGIKTAILSGNDYKKERKQAIQDFREGKITALVATDLASRGLDISGIKYVFSVDIPENPTSYVHRAGRTGRMGADGVSVLISTSGELVHVKRIQSKLKIKIVPKIVKNGEIKNI
jgi:ATP-dependent RNA helicase DeaD